jgi:hypothetical protein
MVSKEMVDEWLSHPVTRVFRKYLSQRRQALMEAWAAGQLSRDTGHTDTIMNAAAIRESQVLAELAALSELDLEEIE